MRVTIISIPVRDQEKALAFYTEKLGFLKKLDMPLGEVKVAVLNDTCGNNIQLVEKL